MPSSLRIASSRARRALGGQVAAVGPGAVAQAKDEAASVVGDDPAVGQRGDDLALRVERDEAGVSRRAHVLRARGKPHAIGEQVVGGVDEGDVESTVTAAAGRKGREREKRKEEPGPHHAPA